MLMKSACVYFAVMLPVGFSSSLGADESSDRLSSAFEEHCFRCHGKGTTVEGKVNLSALKSGNDLRDQPKLLERLITVLRDREMPPEDEATLPDDQRQQLVSQLRTMLEQVLKTQAFEPTPVRRMNRFQYNNAVVDLLELDRDIFLLNERLMRRRQDYFRPETRTMPAEVHVTSRPLSKDIDNQRPEGFKDVAAFPQDQRAEHGFDNRADHLTLSPLLMESFLQLSQSIVESPDLNAKECRSWGWLFAAPGERARGPVDGRYEAENEAHVKLVEVPRAGAAPQNLKAYGNDWSGDAQLFWPCPEEGQELILAFEVNEAGSGLRIGLTKAGDYGVFELSLDDEKIGKTVDLYSAEVVHIEHDVVAQIADGLHTLKFKCVGRNDQSPKHFFGLDYIEVIGRQPSANFNLPSVTETDALRPRLNKLLRRAFRRTVDPETLDRFTRYTKGQLESGASFEDTMRTVVGAVLGMPDFLYFYESLDEQNPDNEGRGRQPVNDFELASRLAQFFWSSIPDDALLDLAESGRLSDPETLNSQIDRMLNDRRSSRFCENFPAQWLQLDRLITAIPDPDKFPWFYYHGYRTSMHMMSEPLLLFETVYIEDLSIIDLLDPKFTWQSDMLRANYEGHSKGAHQVNVQIFQRVPLDDSRRGGVITNAAIMTMTSTPTRTQPITRGAWINAVIFNDPPEPPPADVPPLPESDPKELAQLTIRERLAAHRQRSDCAGCHEKIDPLGFALENYGPTGVWRDKYENGRAVDPGGVLFSQYEFTTAVEFKQIILREKRRFIRGFVAHLLSYALGRELGPADSPALDDMTEKAMAGNDRMRVVLKSVATSEPFLHKNTQDPEKTE